MLMDTNKYSDDEDDDSPSDDSPLELWVDSASETQEHKAKANSKLPQSLDIKNAWYLSKTPVKEEGEWRMYCDDEGRVIAQLVNTVIKKNVNDERSHENGEMYEIDGPLKEEMNLVKTNTSLNTGYRGLSSHCDSRRATQKQPDNSLIVLVNFSDGTDGCEDSPNNTKLSSNGSKASHLKTRTWLERQGEYKDSAERRFNSDITTTPSYLNIDSDSDYLPNPEKESEMDSIIHVHLNEYPCVKNSWYSTKPETEDILVDDQTVVNTRVLVNDLRSFLKRNSIPLKVFSKEHLQRTQGTLSDLLNHPKDWNAMSERGRGIYVKMMEFLSHSNLERLVRALRLKLPARSTAEKLPQHILDCLSVGKMPSETDIAISAAAFPIDRAYLDRYCREQIESWNNEENTWNMDICEDDMQCKLNENGNTSDLRKEEEITMNESVVDAGSQTDISSLAKRKRGSALKYIDRHICTFPGCGAILNNRACYKAHMRHHAGIRLYACKKCDNSFNTKSNLKMHMKIHNPDGEDSNIILSLRKPHDDEMPDNTEVKRNAFTQTATDKQNGNLDQMKYICGVCWEGFKLRQHLQKHLCAVHNVSKPDMFEGFTCYVCAKSMKNISTLLVHMRIHTNDRPFECKQCKTGFHTRANLHRHMRVHTGERPFKCPKCSATFTESKSAKVHMRKHTGEKPYKCPTCNKCFAQLSPLQMHLLIHQNKKPHLCELCGHSFRQKTNLQKHMLRHRGLRSYKCLQCEFAFLTKNDLQRHVLKHTGERPYKCDLCKKSFTRLIYLRDHMKRQQGPTAPKCHYCNKKFCDDNARRKHLKLHSTPDDSVELSLHHASAMASRIHQPSKMEKVSPSLGTVQVHENASPVFLSTKSIFPNEKHYIITAIQSLDGCNEKDIDDVATTASNMSEDTRSIILSNNAESVILEGMNISGHHLPMSQGRITEILPQHNLLFANDSVISSSSGSGRRMLSLAADDTDAVEIGSGSIVEESDPNMQSVVVETDDTMIIFSKSVHGNE